jgi:hypothetical protein
VRGPAVELKWSNHEWSTAGVRTMENKPTDIYSPYEDFGKLRYVNSFVGADFFSQHFQSGLEVARLNGAHSNEARERAIYQRRKKGLQFLNIHHLVKRSDDADDATSLKLHF